MSQFVSVCSGSAVAVRRRLSRRNLYKLIISQQLYLTSQGKEYKFLDDKGFVTLKNTLDAKMKELSATGKRVKHKQAGTMSRHTDTAGRRLLRYQVMKRMHPKTDKVA